MVIVLVMVIVIVMMIVSVIAIVFVIVISIGRKAHIEAVVKKVSFRVLRG